MHSAIVKLKDASGEMVEVEVEYEFTRSIKVTSARDANTGEDFPLTPVEVKEVEVQIVDAIADDADSRV